MTNRTIQMTDALHDYLVRASVSEPPLLARLRAETAGLGDIKLMQISPEQGQFMALLVRLTNARRILELGTFTGYSTLVMALAMPADGRIVACDVSTEWTGMAQRYWAEGGVADRIELRIAPALETLAALRTEETDGAFDLAFIDADKENYQTYYEQVLPLLRRGGLILIDNVLWRGRVADQARHDEKTRAMRALNEYLRDDPRITLSLVPIGDGLSLCLKN